MRAWFCWLGWVGLCAGLGGPNFAHAQLVSGGEGYALIVGSNFGGSGQAALRYAEADTRRVGEVLTTLGGYPADRVERLLQPTAAQLRAALERVQQRVQPLSARGVQSRFFFYYSGHARADALNLGSEQMPLAELRERITSLPATLSIVVLDACQSGAFSRTKGVEKATDFSFNSVERLNTEGIAVIASSNERELSQESDELRSSYFTHHWLVALRGAGDHNHDGRVTLSEAYQYAYNHTLANTARTAVGEQHATLETSLKGQDDVPITHLGSAATARLRVPKSLQGRVLLQALPSWSVLAEIEKAPGEPMVLAVPPGSYAATLRQGDNASSCSLLLRDGSEVQLDPAQCQQLIARDGAHKGGEEMTRAQRRALLREERLALRRARQLQEEAEDVGKLEGWAAELGLGLGFSAQKDSKFEERVRAFGFSGGNGDVGLRVNVALGRRLLANLFVGLTYSNLATGDFRRYRSGDSQEFEWTGHALFAFVQADAPFAGNRRRINLFARVGAGASYAWTTFDAPRPEAGFPGQAASLENTTRTSETIVQDYVRPAGFVSAGVQFMPSRYLGGQLELRYLLAPAIRNELRDYQDLGGFNFGVSMRARTWE